MIVFWSMMAGAVIALMGVVLGAAISSNNQSPEEDK